MVACVRSIDLRERVYVFVFITITGIVRVVGPAGVDMSMRRDKTVRREWHWFR
jgi:hypothetical protein